MGLGEAVNGCGGAGRPKMIKAREDAHHNFLIALIIFKGNQGDQIEYLGKAINMINVLCDALPPV